MSISSITSLINNNDGQETFAQYIWSRTRKRHYANQNDVRVLIDDAPAEDTHVCLGPLLTPSGPSFFQSVC